MGRDVERIRHTPRAQHISTAGPSSRHRLGALLVDTARHITVATRWRASMEGCRATRGPTTVALAVARPCACGVARRLCPLPGVCQPPDPAAGRNPAGGCWPTRRPPGGKTSRCRGPQHDRRCALTARHERVPRSPAGMPRSRARCARSTHRGLASRCRPSPRRSSPARRQSRPTARPRPRGSWRLCERLRRPSEPAWSARPRNLNAWACPASI